MTFIGDALPSLILPFKIVHNNIIYSRFIIGRISDEKIIKNHNLLHISQTVKRQMFKRFSLHFFAKGMLVYEIHYIFTPY
jgi:hypothetical protein